MKINSDDYRILPGTPIKLGECLTLGKQVRKSKKNPRLLTDHVEQLSTLQRLHYASDRYSPLIVFQGMDGAEKDRAIRPVMSGVNPFGCEVFSFKQPAPINWSTTLIASTCRRSGTGAGKVEPQEPRVEAE